MLVITADNPTGIDETSGTQSGGGKHEVSSFTPVLSPTIESLFEDQLDAFESTLSLADAQLAGDPSDGTNGNDVNITGATGPITGLSFVDGNGDFLYKSPTGLTSLAGNPIVMSNGADDNFVIGYDEMTTDVIFIVYIHEVESNGTIVGGDIYVAMFENIHHGDDNNDFDSVLNLTDFLYVAAEQVINFPFAGAPSGQNEFMAFASDGVTIVATGETLDDTVNSGQGANFPDSTDKTALGTNSNDVGAGETLNFNYTTGFDPEFIVPDLTSPEASNADNISYTDVFNSGGAAFNIVKVTGGPASTTPLVQVSAWNNDDAEQGSALISGHGDDDPVPITAIYVNDVALDLTDSSQVTDLGGGVYIILTAVENDRIKIETDLPHNRIAIKNAGDDQVAFSVQAFALESTSTERGEVGSQVDFYDDGPAILGGSVDLALWDDALTGGNPDGDANENFVDTGDLSTLFDPGTDLTGSTFGINPDFTATTIPTFPAGLTFDVAINEPVNIVKAEGTYTGQVYLSIASVNYIEILFNEDGEIRLELLNPLDHSLLTPGGNSPANDNDFYTIRFGDLFAVFDGDGDYQAFQPNDVTTDVEDDAPTISMVPGDGKLRVDEGALSGGNEGGSATDTDGIGALGLFTVTESAGADGPGDTVYSLELSGTTPIATALIDTATGDGVQLIESGDDIIGQTDGSVSGLNLEVFKLEINSATGDVTMTLSRSVEHGLAHANDDPSFDTDVVGLGLTGDDAVLVRGTISDGETPADTASSTVDISTAIEITDDGPDIELLLGGAMLQTDDGALTNGNEGGTATDTDGVSMLFSLSTSDAGADGAGAAPNPTYSLSLSSEPITTSLVDVATGDLVELIDDSGTIRGVTVTNELQVFNLTVAANGDVTLTQLRAVANNTPHADDSPSFDTDMIGLGLDPADAIYLNATLSDGEVNADTDTAKIAIDDNILFTDDGPEMAVGDAAGFYSAGATGTWVDDDADPGPSWDDAAGADGYGTLGVKLTGYQISGSPAVDVSPDLVLTEGSTREYTFSIMDDFNGDGTDETIPFELVFNDDGTYDISATTPPVSVTDFDTSQGTLDAGGPDPVRTLTIGPEADPDAVITFSAVEPDTSSAEIDADLNEGEAHIEATAAYLSDQQLNVSTSGIANGNNVLQGNSVDDGVSGPDGQTTQGGKVDESFVIDPMENVSSVTVTIDNSVGGYNLNTEQLYYRVYDDVSGISDWIPVDSVGPSPLGGGQVDFTIGDPNGDNTIDAVQLAMGTGTIKIPVISFTRSEEFDPESITLDFEATLTDGEGAQGDTHTDDFMVTLAPDPIV